MLPSGALRTRTYSLGFSIIKSCHLCNYHHCCCTVKTALFSMLIFFHLAKWLPVRDWEYFEWEIDWRALWVWEQSTPSFLWLELSLYRKDLRWSIVLQCQLTFVKIDIFRMSNCYVVEHLCEFRHVFIILRMLLLIITSTCCRYVICEYVCILRCTFPFRRQLVKFMQYSDVVLETRVLVSRQLEDKNESLGVEHLILVSVFTKKSCRFSRLLL